MAEKNSLWKNIREKGEQNRRTGATPKKPTREMIRQERKIKAKKADGGEMPLGLPLREQNPFLVPEYNQPIANGYILPDPNRPRLLPDVNASEYKDSHNVNGKKVQVPSIVSGQYLGEPDKSLYRYMISGEEFKPMTDPDSYSKFYDTIEPLGLMKDTKTYADGGPGKKPIYVSNPNDPRIQMYNDSLDLSQGSIQDLAAMLKSKSLAEQKEVFQKENFGDKMFRAYKSLEEKNSVAPEPYKTLRKKYADGVYENYLYKKPTQPYIYKKPSLPQSNKKATLKKETTTPQPAEYRNPVEIEKLNPLKLTAIPTEEIPLALTPFPKQKAYINRGANSGFDANGNPLVSEINLGSGWQQVPYNTLGDYEEIKAEGGYYPTQGPPKALFKGYKDGGNVGNDGGTSKKRLKELAQFAYKPKTTTSKNEPRSGIETLSQFIPGYETYLDLKDIYEGTVNSDKESLNRGVVGLGFPLSGKALSSGLDYITEQFLGKKTADVNADKRNNIINTSTSDLQKIYSKYGPGGYDKWVKDGKPKLAQGGYTNPYNQYQDDPYLNYADGGYMYARGGGWKKFGNTLADVGRSVGDVALGAVGSVTGIKSMQDIIDERSYSNDDFDTGANFVGKLAGTALKYIPVTAPFAQAAGVVGGVANTAIGIDSKFYDPSKHQQDLDKAGDIVNLAGNVGTMFFNPSGAAKEGAAAAKGIYGATDAASKAGQVGKAVDTASTIGNAATTTAQAANTASNIAETAKAASNIGEVVQQANTVANVGQNVGKAVTAAAPVVDSANKLSSGLKYGENYYKAVEAANKINTIGSKVQSVASIAQPIVQQQMQQKEQQKALSENQISTTPVYAKPDANVAYAGITPPTFNTGTPQIGGVNPPNFTFSQGGNITNNSLNLRNTMGYKKFKNGGTLDQHGINFISKKAGLHHQNAYGGVPIGPDALAEGGEAKLQMADGGQYIVSDQVDGANTQTINGQTMAERLKKKLQPFMMGGLASNPRDKENLRRPFDSYSEESIAQIKDNAIQETEAIRMQRGGALQYAANGGKLTKDIEKIVMEEYAAAYGGMLPNKYKGKVNMPNSYAKGGIHIKESKKGTFTAAATKHGKGVQEFAKQVLANKENYSSAMVKKANFAHNAAGWKHADGGYVHNQMTQPMLATGGPLYGDPASPYTYAIGGMYGDPYYRGGQIDYTNDMYSSYAGGGPMVGNAPQAFKGYAAQNRGGMLMNYADGGMMPQEQQMMQEQQMQQEQQGGQDQMMQMVQQVMQALMQGTPPEQIMQQLVQSGVPQEQAQQIIQAAMQEAQGQQQQQPMQGQEQQMPPQQGMMSRGGMMYASGGEDDKGYEYGKLRLTRKETKEYEDDEYDKQKRIYDDRMDAYQGSKSFNEKVKEVVASSNRPFNSTRTFLPWMQNLYDSYNINPDYVNPAPGFKITHPGGAVTNFKTLVADEPMIEPVYKLRETKPLKADLSQDYTPTITDKVQPLPPITMRTPKTVYVNQVNQPGYGVTAENNPAFNYDTGIEINSSDGKGYQKIPAGTYESPDTKEVYPSYLHYLAGNIDEYNLQGNVPQSVTDWADNFTGGPSIRAAQAKNTIWDDKAKMSKATGGMVNPQDGVASQVAQQLQQGADPQQVLQSLVQKGMPQQQAVAMLQAVMGQLKNQMQQQPQQQMMPQEQMAPQPMMAARGGFFNGRKQYDDGGFSPLADESTMSQIAGLGQAVVPALTSAFAFNKLSKRKLTPSLVGNVNIDYTPERINMQEENRRNLASGINTMRNVAPTSGSYMGNVRSTILDANKLSGEQIAKSWQDQKNKQAEYDYNIGSANAGIRNKVNEANEEMYQNAMQTGYEAAGQGVKNVASYYGDLENRKLQRWQAQNTVSENKYWTPKGLAHRDPKTGKYYINKIEVDLTTGEPKK